MATLTPAPRTLGLHSPVIGPWFSDPSLQLPVPDADLAVPLAINTATEWRPPATGFLSFYVSSAVRPLGIAHLRGPNGLAFNDGHLIAHFDLLPQAAERLAALMRVIPTLGTPSVAARATRPCVQSFAIEFMDASPTLSSVTTYFDEPFPPPINADDTRKREYLGFDPHAVTLVNGDVPMRDLARPGTTLTASEKLLNLPSGTNVRLWAFDKRGHAIDPGAVACWWTYLATPAVGFDGLFAEGLNTTLQHTVPTIMAGRLTVHLVNAHEGPLDNDTLARVAVTGNEAGSGALRHRHTGTGGVTLAFTPPAANEPDTLPLPRMAVLPDGRLGDTLTLYENGAVHPLLVRDYVRVSVMSLEHHLTGQPRHADTSDPSEKRARAEDQERATTRVLVDRATRPCLLRTPEDVTAAALSVLRLQDGGTALPAQLVSTALTRDWGVVGGTLPSVALSSLPNPTVTATALTGGGTESGGTVGEQRVLLDVDLGTAAAGAWVRAWPQRFDHATGTRQPLDGGSAVVSVTGVARLLVTLPAGDATPTTPMGADVLVVTDEGARLFADQRFQRPAPVGGTAADAASAAGPFLLCEEGREVAALDGTAGIRSGTHVVALGGAAPTLVRADSVPTGALHSDTFARAAHGGITARLTPPAFQKRPLGDNDATLGTTGITVRRSSRVKNDVHSAGRPFLGQERFELVITASSTNSALGVVGGGPALGARHGLLPHHQAHPLCPAGPDVFTVGARVEGPAVRALAEFTRDRVATDTVALAMAAADEDITVPTSPSSDSLWVAGLRTVGAGVDVELGLDQIVALVGGSGYPFGQSYDAVKTALMPLGISLPASITDPAQRVTRALDRRFLSASKGAREGATALVHAIANAEDFVYIETPAIDDRAFGEANDTIAWLEALAARMDARPGLRVLLCLPVFVDATPPKPLQRVRDLEMRRALATLRANGREKRIAMISPAAGPGRALELATTTVVVDDAWAMVGTTHLWRRGLSYDGSYAITLFDDRLVNGRPQEILAFRRQLCADRLGVSLDQVPDHGADLVDAARIAVARGGQGRLVPDRVRPDAPAEAVVGEGLTEVDVWNPDGSPTAMLNLITRLFGFAASADSEYLNTV